MLYAGISAWYIKLKYNEVGIRIFLYCTVIQQPSKFLFLKQSITWKQAIRLFIEYGTVARLEVRPFIEYGTVAKLEKRTKYCMPVLSPTQDTKTICAIAVDF